MDLGIAGKTAIVCASSKGLGRGCAIALAEAGCNLVINGRDESSLQATADQARAHGVTVTPVIADVSSADGQAALLAACPAPDILINNNGGPPKREFEDLTRQNMIEGVVQNMITPIELIQAVVGQMAANGFGRIVNITSLSVKRPIEGLDLSSGARAGLTALLAGVHPRFAAENVTINNLLPGFMDTDRLRGGQQASAAQSGRPLDEIIAAQRASVPAKRFGTAEEFGQVCAFLCSTHAGYLTGQNILLDGGYYSSAFG